MNRSGSLLIAFLIPLAFLALFAAGCGDDADEPDPTAPAGIAPTSPTNVWTLCGEALADGDSFAWLNAMSPDFTYLPDSATEERHPGVFAGWDYDAEEAFANAMFAASLSFDPDFSLDFDLPDDAGGSTVVWNSAPYTVTVGSEGGDCPTTYGGLAKITFRLEGNFWYVSQWEDLSGVAASWNPDFELMTFGELRALFGGAS